MSTWSEIEELGVEVNLNNRPLTYIEEDLQYSALTPNSMIFRRDVKLPDDSPEEKEVSDNWKKWQRYVYKCKEAAWKWWVHKYLLTLPDRHNLSYKEEPVKININDVLMIKGDVKNCEKWKTRIIENIFMGKDNKIRSTRICTRKSIIERPIQLYIQWSYNVTQRQLPAALHSRWENIER